MTRLFHAFLLGLVLVPAGCGGAGLRKDDAPVVVSAIGADAKLADPGSGPLGMPQRVLLGATAQGLVRFDAAGQIEPGLAERWIVIDDGRSYIFRLREAYWSDDEPVTAAQAVRALRRATAGGSRNELAPFLAVIDEIVAMTPQVIEVRLKRPRPDLLKLFAQPEMAIFDRAGFDGTGPFRARAGARSVALQPVLPPGSDEGEPAPEETLRLFGERAGVAIARFRARASDLVLGGTFADWPIVAEASISPTNIRIDPAIGLFGLAVTSRQGFLEDAVNRAAIAMAIDRAALATSIHSEWAPADTLLPAQLDSAAPPHQPGWGSLSLDARRAAARARVAAWRREHPEPLTLRVALPSGPGGTLLWARLSQSLQSIGIGLERVGPGARADLRLIDAVAPYDSGRWFVATACVACSEATRALIEAAREAPDLASRAQRIADADAALAAEIAFIPLAQPLRWSLVALRLGAWQGNARAWHPLNHLRNETE